MPLGPQVGDLSFASREASTDRLVQLALGHDLVGCQGNVGEGEQGGVALLTAMVAAGGLGAAPLVDELLRRHLAEQSAQLVASESGLRRSPRFRKFTSTD